MAFTQDGWAPVQWLPAWGGRVAGRRHLAFARLEDVMPDVERLLAGHVTVGQWSLGQICSHLALTIQFSMDGFPEQAPWLVRKTLGVLARRRVFRTGRLPKGVRVPEAYSPQPSLDVAGEAAALHISIGRFRSLTASLAEHPLLGPMSQEQWERFHCIHCAHHLSFAVTR